MAGWPARSWIFWTASAFGASEMHHTMPEFGIAPSALEVHALFALDIEIGLVRRLERLRRHAVHPVVDVHELRHRCLLNCDPRQRRIPIPRDNARNARGTCPSTEGAGPELSSFGLIV